MTKLKKERLVTTDVSILNKFLFENDAYKKISFLLGPAIRLSSKKLQTKSSEFWLTLKCLAISDRVALHPGEDSRIFSI